MCVRTIDHVVFSGCAMHVLRAAKGSPVQLAQNRFIHTCECKDLDGDTVRLYVCLSVRLSVCLISCVMWVRLPGDLFSPRGRDFDGRTHGNQTFTKNISYAENAWIYWMIALPNYQVRYYRGKRMMCIFLRSTTSGDTPSEAKRALL